MAQASAVLDLLVYREGDSRFGVDAAQISGILDPRELELHREGGHGAYTMARDGMEIPVVDMGVALGTAEAMTRGDARLVLLRSAESGVGFLIGPVEEVVQVDAGDIDLFPPIMRPMIKGSGMWGVARNQGSSVILIDLVEAAEGIAPQPTAPMAVPQG